MGEGTFLREGRENRKDVSLTRFLLDSGILNDFISNRNGVREKALLESRRGNYIGIGIPVLAEIIYGIEFGENRDRNMRSLKSSLPYLKLWPFDKEAAFEYGRLYAELRRNGRPMQVIDIMIASIAKTLGNCVVVTKDSDFAAIPDLPLAN